MNAFLKVALVSTFLFAAAASAQGLVPEPSFGNTNLSDAQFARIRCEPAGETAYFTAMGAMYSQVEGERGKALFKFLGVDISRCVVDPQDGKPWLVSRKISLYLHPVTGALLREWKNPWTGETVNVMHRTYDYQEFQIPRTMAALESAKSGAVSLDFNVLLPNTLASKPEFADYSPEPLVQSFDSYKFVYSKTDPSDVTLTYFRSGTWEPWMKQKGLPGKLILNYSGHKVAGFGALPLELRTLIDEKMPLFKQAPRCRLERSVAVSWSRFQEVFAAYLRGDAFPLPEPLRDEPCRAAPVKG